MHTPFDWLTVAIFAGLAVLFLQRSSLARPVDSIPLYIPPALGCALANWLGNNGYVAPAIILCFAVLGYVVWVLKPFPVR